MATYLSKSFKLSERYVRVSALSFCKYIRVLVVNIQRVNKKIITLIVLMHFDLLFDGEKN